MIIRAQKLFSVQLDLRPDDRDEMARELVAVLNQPDNKNQRPKLFQLLSVIETVEHGATNGLDVVSDDEG